MAASLSLVLIIPLFLKPAASYPIINYEDCLTLTSQGAEICNSNDYSWCKWNYEYSICQPSSPQHEAHVDAMELPWYDFGVALNWFWLILIPAIYVAMFSVARLICEMLLRREMISSSYFEKCLIYIFDILCAVPIVLKAFVPFCMYDIIFAPNEFNDMKPARYHTMYASVMSVSVSFCFVWMLEMVYARSLRFELKLHHWVSILTMTLAIIALNQRASLDLLRVAASLTLYATTETHTYLQLLLYRVFPSKFVIFHYLSAYLHTLTRVFAFVVISVCYVEWCVSRGGKIVINYNNMFDDGYAYMICFFVIGLANVILLSTQLPNIKSLFIVAEKVRVHQEHRKQFDHPRILQLYEIYASYDTDSTSARLHQDEWSLSQLDAFLQDFGHFATRHSKVPKLIFKALLFIQNQAYQGSSSRPGTSAASAASSSYLHARGLQWKTFLYLFKNELLLVSHQFSTKHIVREKMNLLITGALHIVKSPHARLRDHDSDGYASDSERSTASARPRSSGSSGSSEMDAFDSDGTGGATSSARPPQFGQTSQNTQKRDKAHNKGHMGHKGYNARDGPRRHKSKKREASLAVRMLAESIIKLNQNSERNIQNISRPHDKHTLAKAQLNVPRPQQAPETWCSKLQRVVVNVLRCDSCRRMWSDAEALEAMRSHGMRASTTLGVMLGSRARKSRSRILRNLGAKGAKGAKGANTSKDGTDGTKGGLGEKENNNKRTKFRVQVDGSMSGSETLPGANPSMGNEGSLGWSKESLEMGLSVDAMIGMDPLDAEMRSQYFKRLNSRNVLTVPGSESSSVVAAVRRQNTIEQELERVRTQSGLSNIYIGADEEEVAGDAGDVGDVGDVSDASDGSESLAGTPIDSSESNPSTSE